MKVTTTAIVAREINGSNLVVVLLSVVKHERSTMSAFCAAVEMGVVVVNSKSLRHMVLRGIVRHYTMFAFPEGFEIVRDIYICVDGLSPGGR